MKNSYFCVHGHFYQPPRENPWLEAIERQDSAAPWHDWNERVSAECYENNALARVYGESGLIERTVNNFAWINFNIGPTLFSWLEEKRPATYRAIQEADRISRQRREGHGNAIAQVYNHMIMPLACPRDQETQVRWGVAEFRHRFGREPEAMWLPETACNSDTLRVLAREGLRYAILAPHQVQQCREAGQTDWTDVSAGSIDPTRAYRCFLSEDRELHMDLFFFDGPVSGDISFQDVLASSASLADRVAGCRVAGRTHEELIVIATDGETFGHHREYGERVLAYMLTHEASARGLAGTNFGQYLARHPPTWEVRIKEGAKGLGTSWSCAHGVERWRSNCGCRAGGRKSWRQSWRKPLREALDWLRDTLAEPFEKRGAELLSDPWAARDGYISLILNRGDGCRERFFAQFGARPLNAAERTIALKLLEMQRHTLLMYASCAWFFSELSGTETVQGLKYAARAMELARDALGVDLEEAFLDRLQRARSNLPLCRDGRGVYERMVRPSITQPARIAAHAALTALFAGAGIQRQLYGFEYRLEQGTYPGDGARIMTFGSMVLEDRRVMEQHSFLFAVLRMEGAAPTCYLRPGDPPAKGWQADPVLPQLTGSIARGDWGKVLERLNAHFAHASFGVDDLLEEGRAGFLDELSRRNGGDRAGQAEARAAGEGDATPLPARDGR